MGSPTEASAASAPRAVVVASTVFCFLFAAFFTMQNFLTSVLGGDGFAALALLYGSFALGTNMAPAVVQRMGMRAAMGAASLTYCSMNVAVALAAAERTDAEGNIDSEGGSAGGWRVSLVYLTASLCGLGAAVLWTAQGAYVAQAAQDAQKSVDVAQGTFFAVFSLNGLVGFGLALLLIATRDASDAWLLGFMAVLSGVAVASFVLLPAVGSETAAATGGDEGAGAKGVAQASAVVPVAAAAADDDDGDGDGAGIELANLDQAPAPPPPPPPDATTTKPAPGCLGKIMAMLRMCKRADVALLGPASFHCGCMEGLFWGDVAAKMESSLLVTAYLAHGACSCLSAYATGLAAERFGRRVVHVSLTAVGVVACALAAVALHEGDGSGSGSGSGSGCSVCRDKALVASTALFGCYDLAAQGLVRAALGQRFNGSGTATA